MTELSHLYGLILAGGGGTRLWPKSRETTPKQFLQLTSDRSMIQVTADRFSKFIPWSNLLVITSAKHRSIVKEQLPELADANIVIEPAKKDTALAMLIGALYAHHRDPEAVIVNDAADHVISDDTEFIRLMKAAASVAAHHQNLVAVGITPSEPSTAFGYIKVGEELQRLERNVSVFTVDSFTEKPNRPTAQAFLSSGKYFWNANHYVWSARALIQAFQDEAPDTYQLIQPLLVEKSEKEFATLLPAIYEAAPSISIDYAISEKAKNLVLIPGDFGWNDIGEWKVVYDLGTKNLEKNVIIGETDSHPTLAIRSQGNLIHTNGRLIAVYGINDMIIVDTKDILMIVPKDSSQEVKKLVERLKEEKKVEYL